MAAAPPSADRCSAASLSEPRDDGASPRRGRVCVVGAGVSGLSVALCAIEEGVLVGSEVTIIAEKMYSETTSYIAAGFFRPDEDLAPDLATAEQWYRDSFRHFQRLEALGTPQLTGVKKVPGYNLSSVSPSSTSNRLNHILFSDLRTLTEEELAKFPPSYKYGVYHTTYIADPAKYLKYLENRLRQEGVQFIQYRVENLLELSEKFQVVVNCSGLASKYLANDNRMVPIRGQVVKVRNQPNVSHFYYADNFYILPGVDWVTLGGTKTFGESDLRVSARDREFILQGCYELLPSLQQNEEIADMVGLRPYRSPVRVEVERVRPSAAGAASAFSSGGGARAVGAWIVHNYGHGGQGVNLSWGTARQAVALIARCLASSFPSDPRSRL